MFNQNLLSRLGTTVKNVFALSTSLLTAPVLAVTALTGQGLGAFRLEGVPDGQRQVADVTISPGSRFYGKRLREVAEGGLAIVAHTAPQ